MEISYNFISKPEWQNPNVTNKNTQKLQYIIYIGLGLYHIWIKVLDYMNKIYKLKLLIG